MLAPVALADLVGDEAVGGLAVGYAQQRFGQAHQGDALFRRQREFMHQGVHAGGAGAFFAHRRHQGVGQGLRLAGAGGVAFPDFSQQPLHGRRFIAAVGGRDGAAQGARLAQDFRLERAKWEKGGCRGGRRMHEGLSTKMGGTRLSAAHWKPRKAGGKMIRL